MTQFFIELPDDLGRRARERAGKIGFASAEEYVRALVAADVLDAGEDLSRSTDSEASIESLLLQRLAAPDLDEMTPKVFADIRRRVELIAAAKGS